jgi:prolyl oligopeptidase
MKDLSIKCYFVSACLIVTLYATLGHTKNNEYPFSKTTDVSDHYHGQAIADPYRWLEDLNSKETKDWIKQQNQFSQNYLHDVKQKQSIKNILIKAYDKETRSVPFRVQSKTFFYFNSGEWQQSKLFFRDTHQEKQQLVLDPNTFSDDGTIALGGVDVSPNSELIAYAITDGGSDWKTWKIRNIKTGKDLKDSIAWSKFSNAEWAKDNSGFYYSAYEKPKAGDEYESLNTSQRLFFHKLGQNQTEDQLIFVRPDHPEWGFGATVSEDGKYLVLSISEGTDERNRIFYKDLSNDNSDFIELIGELKAQFSFVGNEGTIFWFFTDLNAPMGRVIAIDINQSEEENWHELIPEKEYPLTNVRELKDFLLCQYLVDVTSRINLYQKKGTLRKQCNSPKLELSQVCLHSLRPILFTSHFQTTFYPMKFLNMTLP